MSLESRIIVALCACVVACVTADAQKKTISSSPPVTITDAQNGKDVQVTSGQILIVKLAGNPSTGYSWGVSGDPAPLKLEKTSYENNTSTPGAPQTAVFQFTAASKGAATLVLLYRRAWEYNVQAVRTFRVNVRVQ